MIIVSDTSPISRSLALPGNALLEALPREQTTEKTDPTHHRFLNRLYSKYSAFQIDKPHYSGFQINQP